MPGSGRADVGVFGGSGFYEFLADVAEVVIETPYGAPSAPITIGTVGGRYFGMEVGLQRAAGAR